MQVRNRWLHAMAATAVLAAPLAAQGLAPTDRGWWTVLGNAETNNYNFAAGNLPGTTDDYLRNWFVFDLSCVEGPITAAHLELELAANSYISADATETYVLYDVSTAPEDLMSGVGGVPVYDDLGQGAPYGSRVMSASDNGSIVSITLNASGLSALNSAVGGLFAVGGAVTTLDGDTDTLERVFGATQGASARLVFDPACEVRDAYTRGQYNDLGTSPGNTYYAVGNWSNVDELRNYFVFDLADLDGLVTSATFRVQSPFNVVTGDAFETYTLFDVDTPVADLISGTASTDGFVDLGTGTAYGSYDLTFDDSGSLVSVPLDPAGLAALNEALGGEFAFGGAITTLDSDPLTLELAFGNFDPAHTITQILLEVESQWAYEGPGLAGTGGNVPLLTGFGDLLGGDEASLRLAGALPGAPAWFVMGVTPLAAPFKGGVLYPLPEFLVGGLPVSPDGTLGLDTIWPLGLPSGVSVLYQFWIPDPAGPVGFAASNGLRSTTP